MGIKSIYVLCPEKNKTGGTELLHQLVYELRENNLNATIAYIRNDGLKENPINEAFIKYVGDNYCEIEDIVDCSDNILIIPEISIEYTKKFKHIKKYVWWLSIDNYRKNFDIFFCVKNFHIKQVIKLIIGRKFRSSYNLLKKNVDVHLVQSYYAKEFLEKKRFSHINYLSDYINDIYLKKEMSIENRDNIVLYNPKKGFEFTERLIRKNPNFKWVAIENMTNQEVVNLLHKSKVYIDFGNHPGKDRFPREAAISGCCIITSKEGSAKYFEDVPIDSKYKFTLEKNNIGKISELIREFLINYDEKIKDFQEYRDFIKGEKKQFKEDVFQIFVESEGKAK